MAERVSSLAGPDLLRECFPLSYQLLKKQKGTWRLVTEVMFPGYVFLSTGDIDAVRERLKLSTSFARLLGAGDAIFSLTSEEAAFVSEFGGARRRWTASGARARRRCRRWTGTRSRGT